MQNIRTAIDSAVKSVNTVAEEVKNGSLVVTDAGRVFVEISGGVSRSTGLLAGITSKFQGLREHTAEAQRSTESIASIVEENASVSLEMAQGAKKVRDLIDNIAAVSEENAASAQEVAASSDTVNLSTSSVSKTAQSLSGLASTLKGMVSRLRL